jgi:hypothetical protein
LILNLLKAVNTSNCVFVESCIIEGFFKIDWWLVFGWWAEDIETKNHLTRFPLHQPPKLTFNPEALLRGLSQLRCGAERSNGTKQNDIQLSSPRAYPTAFCSFFVIWRYSVDHPRGALR